MDWWHEIDVVGFAFLMLLSFFVGVVVRDMSVRFLPRGRGFQLFGKLYVEENRILVSGEDLSEAMHERLGGGRRCFWLDNVSVRVDEYD